MNERYSVSPAPHLHDRTSIPNVMWNVVLALLPALGFAVWYWGWRSLWLTLLGVLAVCLIGPCNGSTYMRYLYPVIACMPFAIGATITRSDLLWS